MNVDVTAQAGRISCFKTYDIRGRVGRDLTEDIAWCIGLAVADVVAPRHVIVGRDCRTSGAMLLEALTSGLCEGGVDVTDIGMVGTEEVYHAVGHLSADAGIAVTASHNPSGDNGMKIVGHGCKPLTEGAFETLRRQGEAAAVPPRATGKGTLRRITLRDVYVRDTLNLVDVARLPSISMVTNAGNGVGGAMFDALVDGLADQGVLLHASRLMHDPDGTFPNGVPTPLLKAQRGVTEAAVREAGAACGVAWDGEADRCFVFDETGTFIDGAHFAALLAGHALSSHPGETVLHDHRSIWPMTDAAAGAGGGACVAKTGHIHMKRAMAETGAIYGGEMSGHHYFRSFMGCDSGMLPWLHLLELLSTKAEPLSAYLSEIVAKHPVSGEMNFRTSAPDAAREGMRRRFADRAVSMDTFDGLSMVFDDWRFNVRSSTTEPLFRLNLEARGNQAVLNERLCDIEQMLVKKLGCEKVG